MIITSKYIVLLKLGLGIHLWSILLPIFMYQCDFKCGLCCIDLLLAHLIIIMIIMNCFFEIIYAPASTARRVHRNDVFHSHV